MNRVFPPLLLWLLTLRGTYQTRDILRLVISIEEEEGEENKIREENR